MSDPANNKAPLGTPATSADWEETLSREIDGLAFAADELSGEWVRRFGDGAFSNPPFLASYLMAIEGHFILSVLAGIHRKAEPGEGATGQRFEERFRESVQGLVDGHPTFDPVSPSILYYLSQAVTQARAEKAKGLMVDPEPIVRILKFTKQLADLPVLSGFRVDLLERFPSRPAETSQATAEGPAASKAPYGGRLRPGHRFRQYEIVKLLGVGGFAEVYLAYHSGLREQRAIKAFVSVPTHGPEHERIRSAFYEEAQTQAKLKHENIVQVHEVDDQGGILILIMEYVEGRNLRSLIDERRRAKAQLSPEEIIKLALDIARGLAYAHSLKIIHRDLKPENILINQAGVAMISDFGLAKPLNDSGQRRTTRMGNLIGTPEYMAPEQVFSEVYDHRVDLYAFGAMLYHMALGEPVFSAKDVWVILEKQKNEAPVPLSTLRQDFPVELDRIVLKLLAKNPEDRYGTADEVARDLEACQGSLSRPGPRRTTSARRWGILAASIALFAAVSSYFWVTHWGHAPEVLPVAREKGLDNAPPRPEVDPSASSHPSKSPEPPAPAEHSEVPSKPARGPASVPAPVAVKEPSPKPVAVPLRQQLVESPLGADDAVFVFRILDVFSRNRPKLLGRVYAPIAADLEALKSSESSNFRTGELEAAQELARLSDELVQQRWLELSESKGEVHLQLRDGQVVQGVVDHAEARAMTIADGRGGKVGVDLSKVASEEFLRGRTIAQAEVAYQGVSGDPAKALSGVRELEKRKERAILWYPVFVRLAKLALEEHIVTTLAQVEAPLARREPRATFEKIATGYPSVLSTLRAMSEAEPDVLSIYPFLDREFKEARVEVEALELLLGGAYSKALSTAPGTQAEKLAATLLLADFVATLEAAHNDLMAKRGWLNYNWELRPDEASIPERTQYWDLLDEGGCVLRDPKGPRSLIMGRPHPRCSEGFLIRFDFETLGEEGATAEWRFNLRREGGGNSYLRFDGKSISLKTTTVGAVTPDETLVTAKLPGNTDEPRTHTCVLIPGEQVHVFLDGALVANLKREDAVLPAQPSLVVKHGKLSIRSILVLKKPSK